MFNGHSGNFPLIDQTIRKLKEDRGVLIPCINIWRLLTPEKWDELHPDIGIEAFGHGGDPLTSVYLHLFPDLVRTDLIEPGSEKGEMIGLPTSSLNAVRFRGLDVNLAVDITDRAANGIAGGDPTHSTAEIGERIADHIVEFTVAFLNHFRTVDPHVHKNNHKEESQR